MDMKLMCRQRLPAEHEGENMIRGLKEVNEVMEQVKHAFSKRQGGLKSVIYVACGGSLASSYPARYLLNAEAKHLRVAGYNSNEFVYATPKSVGENALVICTSTKATAETVEALKIAKKSGAVTIGLTGYEDSLTAQTADYFLTYHHQDEWYEDASYIHSNSQGTAMKIAFWLLKEYEAYPYYDQAIEAFEKLPALYEKAYEMTKLEAAKFAMRYKDDTVWNVLGSGVAYEAVYSDSFCFFQEMQTVHCVPTHSGEYFHGAFETTDQNLAVLLLKSVGRTRYLDERVEKFLNHFGGHHYIVDAEALGVGELDEHVGEYFNSLILHPVSKQMIAAMGDVRMHPLSYRRYMWKFDY